MATSTGFRNTTATTARATETSKTAAQFLAGCGSAASNSPGIGITETSPVTALSAVSDAWTYSPGWNQTLLDQKGVARTPQVGQVIGGLGWIDRSTVAWPSSGGVEGNGAAQAQFIVMLTNPVNVNGAPDPAYPAPTESGAARLTTLAAGWTSP